MTASNINLCSTFDTHQYGCVRVDMHTGLLHVRDRTFVLSGRTGNLGNANIAASFISLAYEDPQRASLKTMTELSSAKNSGSFVARLSLFRTRLKKFEIAHGINAASLFLSDRLIGNQINDHSNGLEKLPYHFNTALVHLIDQYGFILPEEKLAGVRIEKTKVLGPIQDPEEYKEGLGEASTASVPAVSHIGFQDPRENGPKYPERKR